MGIAEFFVVAFGSAGMMISFTVGLGIVLSPIAAFIFWKWPHIYEACRSYAFSGALYKTNEEPPCQIKEFGEWAGFKNESTPTAP